MWDARSRLAGPQPADRNAYTSPGYWNFNFVFAKNFKLTERFQMQFRAEMYNAFNHANLYILPYNLDVSGGLSAVQVDRGGTNPNGPGVVQRRAPQRPVRFEAELLTSRFELHYSGAFGLPFFAPYPRPSRLLHSKRIRRRRIGYVSAKRTNDNALPYRRSSLRVARPQIQ